MLRQTSPSLPANRKQDAETRLDTDPSHTKAVSRPSHLDEPFTDSAEHLQDRVGIQSVGVLGEEVPQFIAQDHQMVVQSIWTWSDSGSTRSGGI